MLKINIKKSANWNNSRIVYNDYGYKKEILEVGTVFTKPITLFDWDVLIYKRKINA